MEEKIKARRDELIKARDAFIVEANQKVAGANAAIGELSALLEPESVVEVTPDASTDRPGR